MIYELKDCRNGGVAAYKTTVEITENDGLLKFKFVCSNSKYYCPYHTYNSLHSLGDVCEVFIGSDLERKHYFEIELSPENVLMIAKMTYKGLDDEGKPSLDLDFVEDSFIESTVVKTEDGYIAELTFPREKILTGDGRIYFNAYRIETDGGEMEKHLFALYPTLRPKFHVPDYYRFLDDALIGNEN